MATDAALRNAGVTIEYAYDLQSCTVTARCLALGLDATAKDANRVSARRRALSALRDQRLTQKAHRVARRYVTGSDLTDCLEALGITAYKSMPRTDAVPQVMASGYQRPLGRDE